MAEVLWTPTKEVISNTEMFKFISYMNDKYRLEEGGYDSFYAFSIEEPELFWSELLVYSDIKFTGSLYPVLTGDKMFGSKWFSDVQFNFAENLLRFRNNDSTALVSYFEGRFNKRITYKQLYGNVLKIRGYLEGLGIQPGDVIAGFTANVPEAVIAMLASVSLGAVWTSCSADFGVQGVVDRFGQTKPKVLFGTAAYFYNGKEYDCLSKINEVTKLVQSIEKVVLLTDDYNIDGFTTFNSLLNLAESTTPFKLFNFNHPLYIMYSSGTTGKPKCIVHGAGGTLLQHYKELVLHTDLSEKDTIFYYTTCGWMMWNWLISSLFTGAKIVLYDGSPMAKGDGTLWKISEEEEITIFGTSPKYLSVLEKSSFNPIEFFNLSKLKTILSTGAPLSIQQFKYVYQSISSSIRLSSISGGTDIISCFMLGSPISPVYEGEIQKRGLGMAVKAFDTNGNSIEGTPGELCCTHSFPSMPIYFHNDESGEKYKNAYFGKYEDIWWHGDYIQITENNGVVVFGRSDATLNPGGVRIGSSEIYEIVEHIDFIQDSIAVGFRKNNDIEILLFVVLKSGIELNDALIKAINGKIKAMATPRHVPAQIFAIADVPRTINGKKVELAVTRIINNDFVDNLEVISNPEALNVFYELREKIKS